MDQIENEQHLQSQRTRRTFLHYLLVISITSLISGSCGYFIAQLLSMYNNCSTPVNNTTQTVSMPTTQPLSQTQGWQTYQNEDVTFDYPIDWVKEPILIRGSGYDENFYTQDNKYWLTFSVTGNYSQLTGKPYSSLDEYVGMKSDTLVVDGQEGKQILPRAGSENVNSVALFSKDKKYIFRLELKTGDTPLNTSEANVNEGKRLFSRILSTFKFNSYNLSVLKKATVLVQDASYYAPDDPDLVQLEVGSSQHFFAKSNKVDLKKYIGKKINISYRDEIGVVVGEQQYVIVESIE
jgi:hypothetical protein